MSLTDRLMACSALHGSLDRARLLLSLLGGFIRFLWFEPLALLGYGFVRVRHYLHLDFP